MKNSGDTPSLQVKREENAGRRIAHSKRRFTRSDGHLHAFGADLHALEGVCTVFGANYTVGEGICTLGEAADMLWNSIYTLGWLADTLWEGADTLGEPGDALGERADTVGKSIVMLEKSFVALWRGIFNRG
jgi:hypothetical protein